MPNPIFLRVDFLDAHHKPKSFPIALRGFNRKPLDHVPLADMRRRNGKHPAAGGAYVPVFDFRSFPFRTRRSLDAECQLLS